MLSFIAPGAYDLAWFMHDLLNRKPEGVRKVRPEDGEAPYRKPNLVSGVVLNYDRRYGICRRGGTPAHPHSLVRNNLTDYVLLSTPRTTVGLSFPQTCRYRLQ